MGFIRNFLRYKEKQKAQNQDVPLKQLKFVSEDDYYEWFFTKNKDWNTANPNYDESVRWRGIKTMVKQVKKQHADLNILDLGCGRGWLTNLLSQYGTVLGIEPIKQVADYAKTLFPSLKFFSGDAGWLIDKGYSKSFDLVVSSEVIEHVPDQAKADFLLQVRSLLKGDGFAILSTPRREALSEYLKHIQPSQPIEEWLAESDMRILLVKNGFRIVEMQRLTKSLAGAIDLEVYQLWLIQKDKD